MSDNQEAPQKAMPDESEVKYDTVPYYRNLLAKREADLKDCYEEIRSLLNRNEILAGRINAHDCARGIKLTADSVSAESLKPNEIATFENVLAANVEFRKRIAQLEDGNLHLGKEVDEQRELIAELQAIIKGEESRNAQLNRMCVEAEQKWKKYMDESHALQAERDVLRSLPKPADEQFDYEDVKKYLSERVLGTFDDLIDPQSFELGARWQFERRKK